MKSTKIPYLYSRNGIFYYRYQSTWKSLKTRCKREAFRKLSHILFGTSSSADDHQPVDTVTKTSIKKETVPKLSKLIQAYMKENGSRWNAREYTRINSILKFNLSNSFSVGRRVRLCDLPTNPISIRTGTASSNTL
jgi:hypothetical protein